MNKTEKEEFKKLRELLPVLEMFKERKRAALIFRELRKIDVNEMYRILSKNLDE